MAKEAIIDNKRIAKNTVYLYIRMFFATIVSLYTSRVILNVLGVVDYGIYNVVGGVVSMFVFLQNSMSVATQRYLNIEMGKSNMDGMNKVFSLSLIGYTFIALTTIVLAETIGLWFVLNKLVIPAERLQSALWVYHFSVVSFAIGLFGIPYGAAIVAHEKFSFHMVISFIGIGLKLLCVFMLMLISWDKLKLFAILSFLSALIVLQITIFYTRCKFQECRFRRVWDGNLMKGLFSFSGWMMVGSLSHIFSTQGINMLINIYFGPALNAARGIAMAVMNAVYGFVTNFMLATKPQIVKSYAAKNYDYMYKLTYSASKISFYLLFILVAPILLNTKLILTLWLKNVPDYAVLFTQLTLIDLMLIATNTPMASVAQAAGKIRGYQLTISIGFILVPTLSWICYKMGASVESAFYILIITDAIGWAVRIWILKVLMSFPVKDYLMKVICKILIVCLISIPCMYLIHSMLPGFGTFKLIIECVLLECIVCVIIWFFGMDFYERNMVGSYFKNMKKKLKPA